MHVVYGHGLVFPLARWRNTKGKGAILGVFVPIDSALYGLYSGMNFTTKVQFGLNLLVYRKVGQNLISCC